ncbi:hypothetical protein QE152_g15388 [Popillia japonica]|uniref:Uncharacterized protein n=1 Tax=Popillia japonica TaxID=7064 RepID=A0AAW1L814_POPJA
MRMEVAPVKGKLADEELAAIAVILDEEEEERRTKKRKWVHEAWRKREREGELVTLYKELIADGIKFYQYFRMSECCFNILLSKLSIYLQKRNTHWRKPVTPKERLAAPKQIQAISVRDF